MLHFCRVYAYWPDKLLSAQINAADARRKEQEQQAAATRSAEVERKALEDAKARGPPAGHFKQIIETFEPLDTIFDEIDLLEEDPPHPGVAMRNARFRPYWIQVSGGRKRMARPVGQGRL
jgi:hypothetical protein